MKFQAKLPNIHECSIELYEVLGFAMLGALLKTSEDKASFVGPFFD
jgi:hypothetical protein